MQKWSFISRAQGKRLALHHAAMSGAPFDVMEMLLEANTEAATKADKARAALTARVPRRPHHTQP